MKYKNVLITGGAGFVGSNIAINYKRQNPAAKVVVLDNLRRRGSELNIGRLKEKKIDFLHGDIRNSSDLDNVGKTDLIIECSAECSVLAGYNSSPRYVIDTNLIGMINCLELARKYKAGFIFLSTSRVYPIEKINSLKFSETDKRFELKAKQSLPGVSAKGFSEHFSLEGARSIYGATKLAGELLLKEYINGYGIKGVINRCGIISGPWQMGKADQGIIALWIAAHIYGKKLSYIGFAGKGKQVRDVLHIDDLYNALAIQWENLDYHNGQVYNIGGGRENTFSLKELTDLCQAITHNKILIEKMSLTRQADIIYYATDYSKFANTAGWSPKANLNRIIADVASWINENRQTLNKIL